MKFEWDPSKASLNLSKHGVSFVEAATVFLDPLAVSFEDPDHPSEEDRWISIGLSTRSQLILVAHTDRGEAIRIISARMATSGERRHYEHGDTVGDR